MKVVYVLFVSLLTFISSSFAEIKPIKDKTKYDFWLSLPTNYTDQGEKQPILVFLHGKSLSGTNLERVKRYGVLKAISKGRDIPAIVVAPQTSSSWNPDNVIEIIDYILKNYNADSSRVYVCGMSMGGYGTLNVAGQYPERIAAAVAICGGASLTHACNLSKVPVWIQHGNRDFVVPVSESKKIYHAIKKCNSEADATLTIIPGGTHGSVERLFHKDAIYDWMFSYKNE